VIKVGENFEMPVWTEEVSLPRQHGQPLPAQSIWKKGAALVKEGCCLVFRKWRHIYEDRKKKPKAS